MAAPNLDKVVSLIIEAHAIKGSTVVIGVTGGVAVGKSTFANTIAMMLADRDSAPTRSRAAPVVARKRSWFGR